MIEATAYPKRKYPGYFAGLQRQLAKIPLPRRLATIQKYGEIIRTGDHRVVANLLRLVAASDFRPKVLTAAREAMQPIAAIKFGRLWPLEQFGINDYGIMDHPYFLGALFECLPPELGVFIFGELYLGEGYRPEGSRLGGQALLRFSNAPSAARFLRGLYESNPEFTLRHLHQVESWKVISTYEFRRYEARQLLRAFNAQRPS